MIFCIISYNDLSRDRGSMISKPAELSFAVRVACIQIGDCYPGSFSISVASSRSKMLFDIYSKHGEVWSEAKAVFHF